MQHTTEVNECRVFVATMPAHGVTSATINAHPSANIVHIHHAQMRAFLGSPKIPQEDLAKACASFLQRECEDTNFTGEKISNHMVVNRVRLPKMVAQSSGRMRQGEGDCEAQCDFF